MWTHKLDCSTNEDAVLKREDALWGRTNGYTSPADIVNACNGL